MYHIIESNEALGSMRYLGETFYSWDEADVRAFERFGDPARRRSFYCYLIECPDGSRVEIIRGVA